MAPLILSPEKNFIFFHVPKAAGTSIHGALGHLDVFHKVRRKDEAARRRHALALGLPEAAAGFRQHTTVRQAIEVLGREAFARYYTFCFVRNPFDAMVSWFHYRLQNAHIHGHAEAASAGSFADYVRAHVAGPEGRKWVEAQHRYVTDADGRIGVSFVGRLERLAEDFQAVTARLGLKALVLDQLNQSTHGPWTGFYTRETFAMVAEHAGRDAELFGYSSDPAAYNIA